MDIVDQIKKYFANVDDVDKTAKGEIAPISYWGNIVTPLIDGYNYFGALRKLLESMGSGSKDLIKKQFFYITGWFSPFAPISGVVEGDIRLIPKLPKPLEPKSLEGAAFKLDDGKPSPPIMANLLAQKASQGVDVRVMTSLNPYLLTPLASNLDYGMWEVNMKNALGIDYLRNIVVIKDAKPPMALRACLLTVGHLLGSIHMKMAVASDGKRAIAFVGGIDLHQSRATNELHLNSNWHDMAISVEGNAVEGLYNVYRDLWNEQVGRSPVQQSLVNGKIINAVETGTEMIPIRKGKDFPISTSGKHWVQIACTLPQFNFPGTTKLKFGMDPLKYAPNGLFEIKVARKKAILNATEYIYIENPDYWSHDLMDWINSTIKFSIFKETNLKVIILRGTESDPTDAKTVGDPFLREAVAKHLVKDLDLETQKSRIGFFWRKKIYSHGKVMIIDDHWLFAGSANTTRRSLFTDAEVSVATLDTDDVLAKTVRVNLWGEHFRKTGAQRTLLSDINVAMAVWGKKGWGSTAPYTINDADSLIYEQPLDKITGEFSQGDYDLKDWDSRQIMTPEIFLAIVGSKSK
jgi:phosphatidylserine/phosphatidylglycerophosphate/cardiolipin synthase-like enzyme